jgi:predicted acyl esterase
MTRRSLPVSPIIVACLGLASSLAFANLAFAQDHAQDSADVRANYTKQEVLIATRDGTKLFTAVYTPKDQTRSYPIMMQRTPYSDAPYGPDAYPRLLGPSGRFEHDGFIFVYQDVRGHYESEGTYANVRPLKDKYSGPTDTGEATDTYDTMRQRTPTTRSIG